MKNSHEVQPCSGRRAACIPQSCSGRRAACIPESCSGRRVACIPQSCSGRRAACIPQSCSGRRVACISQLLIFVLLCALGARSLSAAPSPVFTLKVNANGTIISTGLPNSGIVNFETGKLTVNGVAVGGSGLPTQTGHTGEYLTTNGTAASWTALDILAGGAVTDGDKGDITVSSSASVFTIDNNTVSLAKMADMATASFLGRNTAGSGDPEVLSISTVKTMLAFNFSDISGTVAIGQLPTGTSGGTVALGNHTHTGVYDPAGTAAALINDTAYNATSWDGDTTHAPSKNAVRDKIENMGAGPLTARVSSQFDKTDDTLANIPGLSVTVSAGKTYSFRAVLFTTLNPEGGFNVAMAGTATATSFVQVLSFINGNLGGIDHERSTTFGGAYGDVGYDAKLFEILGTITVNAGGTLTVKFAQGVADPTASSVLVGSTLIAQEIP